MNKQSTTVSTNIPLGETTDWVGKIYIFKPSLTRPGNDESCKSCVKAVNFGRMLLDFGFTNASSSAVCGFLPLVTVFTAFFSYVFFKPSQCTKTLCPTRFFLSSPWQRCGQKMHMQGYPQINIFVNFKVSQTCRDYIKNYSDILSTTIQSHLSPEEV